MLQSPWPWWNSVHFGASKLLRDSSAALANRWRGVDPACLDLTDLPQPFPPIHPPPPPPTPPPAPHPPTSFLIHLSICPSSRAAGQSVGQATHWMVFQSNKEHYILRFRAKGSFKNGCTQKKTPSKIRIHVFFQKLTAQRRLNRSHILQEVFFPEAARPPWLEHSPHTCHFTTLAVHRPVFTEQLKWIRQTKGFISTTVRAQREELSGSAAAPLQTLDSAPLLCHWGSHFPMKAHEIAPRPPAVPCRNQLPRFDESTPFISLNCPIKGWFLSFIVRISGPQENMNFTPVWFCLRVGYI